MTREPRGTPTGTPTTGVEYSPLKRPGASRFGRRVDRARERLVVALFRAASRAIAAVPERASLPIARAVFRIGYHGWPAKRKIILANATHVLQAPLSDPAVGRLAKGI